MGGSGPVLVTGAHGAIGPWVVRELVRRGTEVFRFDAAPDPLLPFPELGSSPLVVGDLRADGVVAALLASARPARVIHLAAIVGAADRDPVAAIEVNSLATARLLALAADSGVARVVAMSTKGVLGPLDARYLHPHYEPVPVDHPPSPRTVYESTKYLVEVAVREHRARGGDAAAVRLASTWGPGKSSATHPGFGLHGDVLARALRGEGCRLDAHPQQGYDLVYYADVAAGLVDLALAPNELREPVYHLGSGRITTVAQFATAVEEAFPGVRVDTGTELVTGRSCLMDIAPIRRDAGYEPAWDVRAALADVRSLVGSVVN
jgi:nucleoside-diphosphate-sugar epimerase